MKTNGLMVSQFLHAYQNSRVRRWSDGIYTSTVAGSLFHLQGGFVRRGDGRLDRIQAPVGAAFCARERVWSVWVVTAEIPAGQKWNVDLVRSLKPSASAICTWEMAGLSMPLCHVRSQLGEQYCITICSPYLNRQLLKESPLFLAGGKDLPP